MSARAEPRSVDAPNSNDLENVNEVFALAAINDGPSSQLEVALERGRYDREG